MLLFESIASFYTNKLKLESFGYRHSYYTEHSCILVNILKISNILVNLVNHPDFKKWVISRKVREIEIRLHLTPVGSSSLSINETWLDLRPSEIFLKQDPLYKLTHISINKRDRAKRLKSSLLRSINICLLRIWARSGDGPEQIFSENF